MDGDYDVVDCGAAAVILGSRISVERLPRARHALRNLPKLGAGEKGWNRVCVGNWRRNSGLHPCDRSWPFRPTVFIVNIVQRDQIRSGSIPCLLGISDAVREGREDAWDSGR